jgi:hypothetical protein
MNVITSDFDVVYKVIQELQEVSAGISIFLNKAHKFSRNLMSKSARSTLTSPGTIRVHFLQTSEKNQQEFAIMCIFPLNTNWVK